LVEYVSGHPAIELGERSSAIPEELRPEFYRLFDAVQHAFLHESFANLLDDAVCLSARYTQVEQRVMQALELDDVVMMAGLARFLRDPVDGLARELFEPLFSLMQGRLTVESFEQIATARAEAAYERYSRLGYKQWIELSLVDLFDADRLFNVVVHKPSSKEIIKRSDVPEPVPMPEESRALSFERDLYPIYMVPDFIVHSGRLNAYVALTSEFSGAFWPASDPSRARDWIALDVAGRLGTRLVLIHVSKRLEEIALIMDKERISRPDVTIEYVVGADWSEEEGTYRNGSEYAGLNPSRGAFLVTRHRLPDGRVSGGARVLAAGLDEATLSPIVDALAVSVAPDGRARREE